MQKTKTLAEETAAFLKRTILSLRFWEGVLLYVLRFFYLLVFRPKALFPSVSPSLRLKLSISIASILLLAISPFVYKYYKIQEAKPNYYISKNYFGGDYEYQTKNKDFSVSFVDKKDQSKPWVDFQTGQDSVKMALEEVQSAKFKVQSFSDAENGGKKKDQLVFADVRPDTDLTYDIIDSGVKEELVLKSEKALKDDNTYNFTLDTKNVEPIEISKGIYSPAFRDKSSGSYAFHFLRPVMTDAAGAKSDQIQMQIKDNGDGKYSAVLRPSSKWLHDKDRKFPIKIDPSIVHSQDADFAGTNNRTEDPTVDGNDSYTKLLLHMDGADGGTSFADSEATPKAVTANGDTKTKAGQSKFSQAGYFDGSGDYLSVPDSDDWNFGSGDFTIDTWVYFSSISSAQEIFSQYTDGNNYATLNYQTSSSIGLRFSVWSGGSNVVSLNQGNTSGWSAGNWYHVAATRSGNTWSIYRDGVLLNSVTANVTYPNLTGNFVVGSYNGSSEYWNGYFDEFRVTKGTARWTSAFTPPAKPYGTAQVAIANPSGGNDQYTKLLLHGDGANNSTTFTDSEMAYAQRKTVTAVGSAKISTTQSEFGGSSMYFNGSTDYLSVSDSDDWNFGSGDFTMDTWVNFSSLPSSGGYQSFFSQSRNGGSSDSSFWVGITNNAGTYQLLFFTSTSGSAWTGSPTFSGNLTGIVAGNWYHFAIVRSGNNAYGFWNGTQVGSGTLSGSLYNSTRPLFIGAISQSGDVGYTYYLSGYLDELRISKGTARWTSNFTPPTRAYDFKKDYAAYSSPVVDAGGSTTWNTISWTENGVATGDGETPYSTTNLVAQWNFNGTSGTTATNDAGTCGSSCNATLYNMTTTGQDASATSGWTANNKRWGAGALMFDGTDDYVGCTEASCGGTSKLDFAASDEFTVSAWIKTNDAGNGIIMSKGTTLGNGPILYFRAGAGGNMASLYLADGATAISVGGTSNVIDGNWHYVVGVKNSSYIKIYVDGREEGSASSAGFGAIDSPYDFFIGRATNYSGANYYYKGLMDSPQVYKRAMTASEVLSNYQAGNVEMQTRTGSSSNPNDGTWEAWKPAGTGSETQIASMDSDSTNWQGKYDPYTKLQITPKGSSIYDESNASRTITNSGAATIVTDAGVTGGKAINLTTSQSLTAASSPDFALGTTFTIDFWYNSQVTSWTANAPGIFNIGTMDSTGGLGMYVYSSGFAFANGSYVAAYYGGSLTKDQWRHVALVADGVNIKLYIDGVLYATRSVANVTQSSLTINTNISGGLSLIMNAFKIADFRISKGIARWTGNFTPPAAPYDTPGQLTANNGTMAQSDNTKLILHADGTNNSTTFTDSSIYARPIVANGNAQISTAQSKFGGSSASFDGNSTSYLAVPDSDDWSFGTGDFTIDSWIKINSWTSNGLIVGQDGYPTNPSRAFDFRLSGTTANNNKLQFLYTPDGWNNVNVDSNTVAINDGAWHHVAVVRDTATLRFFVDGSAAGTYSIGTAAIYNAAQPLTMGYNGGSAGFNGYVDDLRITKGVARWTSNFTPSTSAVANPTVNSNPVKAEGSGSMKVTNGIPQCDGNTTALWHMDETGGTGAYIKDSCGGNDGTPTGTTSSVDGFTGKARNFGGSSSGTDYVSVPDSSNWNFGSNDFTIDTWAKFNSVGNPYFISQYQSGGAYWIAQYYAGNLGWGANGANYACGAWTPTAGTWYHLAWSVTGGTSLKCYVNGVQFGSAVTIPSTGDYSAPLTIGAMPGNSNVLSGSLDEVRVSKGYARSADEIAETYRAGKDWRLSRTISSTDLSGKSKLPFYVAADRPGTYMDATIGESNFANYESDSNTVLQLHGDEIPNSTTIKDSSPAAHVMTANGDAKITASGKIGNAMTFDGTGDYFSTPDSNDFNFGSGDFTIDTWVYFNGWSGTGWAGFYSQYVSGSYVQLGYYNSTQGLGYDDTAGCTLYQGNTNGWSLGSWYHVAVSRIGTSLKIYRNGTVLASGTCNAALPDVSSPLYIGTANGSTHFMNGYIDELRVTKGTGYTASDIRQAYEVGKRTHSITIDFAASLDSGNLISDSSDTSFTINSQTYGATNKGDNLYAGDKVIVKENWNGTEYIAQGTVTNVNQSTGAVTVNSWDTNSIFPSGGQTGFSANATVFKWQREYMDLTGIQTNQRDAATRLTMRLTDGSEGRNIYLDDFEDANYLTNPATTGNIQSSAGRYLQYRTILTTNDNSSASNLTPSISQVSLDSQDPIPSAPTNVQATDGTHTDKVTVTWTKSSSATGYRVYRDGVQVGTDLGDVATYDDTGAGTPSITAGTVSASEGSSPTQVNLALTGQSANDGTHHSYKVVAFNSNGASGDSSTDTGYRGAGALTVQWQVSQADSDADYSDIPGAATASYTYTDAPAGPVGRYYRAVLNATGASQVITDAERGNMAGGAIELKPGTSFKRDVEFR